MGRDKPVAKITRCTESICVILSGSEAPVLEGNCSAALQVPGESRCWLLTSSEGLDIFE